MKPPNQQTETELFRLTANWHPHSIDEVRKLAACSDLITLRGKNIIEGYEIKPGMTIGRAMVMIRHRKGNSRLRFFVTTRANNRL